MIVAFRDWWTGLSARERTLVTIALALAAPLIGWFLVVVPLRDGLTSAQAAHNAALDRHAAVTARVALLHSADGIANSASRDASQAGSVSLLVGQRAADAGLTLSRNDPAGDSRAAIAIPAARAPVLLGWLAALEDAGITSSDLSLRHNGDGTVALTATLARAQ
jgi:general secretion pathway protein M